ncbi:hypothetical protein N197_04740 [Helicobacter pylori UM023]|nr:hypothetical protein N197_04740 [Helicobacter pylori UM023]
MLSKIHSLMKLNLMAWVFNKTRDLKSDKEFSRWWHSNPLKRV